MLKRACPHCAVCGDGRPAKVAGGTRLPQFCLGQDPKIKAYRSPAASPVPFSKTWPTRARHHAHSRVEQLVPRFEATFNPGALEQDGRQPPDRDSTPKGGDAIIQRDIDDPRHPGISGHPDSEAYRPSSTARRSGRRYRSDLSTLPSARMTGLPSAPSLLILLACTSAKSASA